MNIQPSPDRYSIDKKIQEEQGKIDKLDGQQDGQINVETLSDDEKIEAQKVYIEKVNVLQGAIRRSYEKIDLQKDLRSKEWRNWEEDIRSIEADLYLSLVKEYRRLLPDTEEDITLGDIASFNLQIDDFLNSISKTNNKYQHPRISESLNEQGSIPRSVEEIFASWGVIEKDEELLKKTQSAIEHYGEKQIRDLAACLVLYDSLSKKAKQKLFNTSRTPKFDQVAGQLANGTFESSNLSFLLTEGIEAIEQRLLTEREAILDKILVLSEQVVELKERSQKKIVQLCELAKVDVAEGAIPDMVAWVMNSNGHPELQAQIVKSVQKMAVDIGNIEQQIGQLSIDSKRIELVFNAFDSTVALNTGDKNQEAQLAFRLVSDFGIDIDLAQSQLQLLRPSQQQLAEGDFAGALRTSIDEYNRFILQHPEMDEIDRANALRLFTTSKQARGRAKFKDVEVYDFSPFRQDENTGMLQQFNLAIAPSLRRGVSNNLLLKKKTISVLETPGMIDNENELIVIQLPGTNTQGNQTVIALRGADGQVRLQGGQIIDNPLELEPVKISGSHIGQPTVYVSPQTASFLQNKVRISGVDRVILRNNELQNLARRSALSGTIGDGSQILTLSTSQLQLASQYDEDQLIIRDANGNVEQNINAGSLIKQNIEHGQDVLRSIDNHPLITDMNQRAGELQGNMQGMQTMLSTAMDAEANVSDEFVGQLRDYARPMHKILSDPTTKENAEKSRELLQQELARIQTGNYRGRGMESEIIKRINALDGYINVLEDNKLLHGVKTALEVRPDTWSEWFSKDGLIMLGSIVVAVVAIGILTVATGGAGLIAVSAVGAGFGLIGAEGTKELLYQYENNWGGASTGEYLYTNGSRVGNYVRGKKMYNSETNEFVDMSFLDDVALPYAQEFLTSFATTALALGAGQVAGKALSSLAQNSKIMQAIAKNSGIANNIMKRLSGLTDEVAKIPGSVSEFAKSTFKEVIDELKDELVLEAGVAQGLMRIDKRLAFLSTFIVATAKGFKPLRGGQFEYDANTMDADAVQTWATEQGHTIVSESDGVFDIKTFDGQTLLLQPSTTNAETESSDEANIVEGENNAGTNLENINLETIESNIANGSFSEEAVQSELNNISNQKIQELFIDLCRAKADRVSGGISTGVDFEVLIAQKLGVDTLSTNQMRAILSAHMVGIESGGSIDTGYSQSNITKKTRTLRGFDTDGSPLSGDNQLFNDNQRRIIMQDLQLAGINVSAKQVAERKVNEIQATHNFNSPRQILNPKNDAIFAKVLLEESPEVIGTVLLMQNGVATDWKDRPLAEEAITKLSDQQLSEVVAFVLQGIAMGDSKPIALRALHIARSKSLAVKLNKKIEQVSLTEILAEDILTIISSEQNISEPSKPKTKEVKQVPKENLIQWKESKKKATVDVNSEQFESTSIQILQANFMKATSIINAKAQEISDPTVAAEWIITSREVNSNKNIAKAGVSDDSLDRSFSKSIQERVIQSFTSKPEAERANIAGELVRLGKPDLAIELARSFQNVAAGEIATITAKKAPYAMSRILQRISETEFKRSDKKETQDILDSEVKLVKSAEKARDAVKKRLKNASLTNDDFKNMPEVIQIKQEVLRYQKKFGDIPTDLRITLANTLLNIELNTTQQSQLQIAHTIEGEIDNLTPEQKLAKGKALMQNDVFSRIEAQLLLDAGLAGRTSRIDRLLGRAPKPRKVAPKIDSKVEHKDTVLTKVTTAQDRDGLIMILNDINQDGSNSISALAYDYIPVENGYVVRYGKNNNQLMYIESNLSDLSLLDQWSLNSRAEVFEAFYLAELELSSEQSDVSEGTQQRQSFVDDAAKQSPKNSEKRRSPTQEFLALKEHDTQTDREEVTFDNQIEYNNMTKKLNATLIEELDAVLEMRYNNAAPTLEFMEFCRQNPELTMNQAYEQFSPNGADITEKYKGANCVSLGQLLQRRLEAKGIKSFIVGSKGTNQVMMLDGAPWIEGLEHSTISHGSLVVPHRNPETGSIRYIHIEMGVGRDLVNPYNAQQAYNQELLGKKFPIKIMKASEYENLMRQFQYVNPSSKIENPDAINKNLLRLRNKLAIGIDSSNSKMCFIDMHTGTLEIKSFGQNRGTEVSINFKDVLEYPNETIKMTLNGQDIEVKAVEYLEIYIEQICKDFDLPPNSKENILYMMRNRDRYYREFMLQSATETYNK